jgi:predicted transcriptional regulator
MKRVEAKPAMAALLADARRNLAKEMGIDSRSFRMLRLQSGLSQTKLAERARVTQSYVARVEAGSVDPGTEMIVRLSEALGAPAEKVFVAIIAQRVSQNV